MRKAEPIRVAQTAPPDLFQQVCKARGLPVPESEFRFDSKRRWRFDYAFVQAKVAIEVEGAVWTNGRHTRGSGFVKDMEKYNAATVAGWRLLRCTPQTLVSADVLDMIQRAIDCSLEAKK